jgi:hypothetical protein
LKEQQKLVQEKDSLIRYFFFTDRTANKSVLHDFCFSQHVSLADVCLLLQESHLQQFDHDKLYFHHHWQRSAAALHGTEETRLKRQRSGGESISIGREEDAKSLTTTDHRSFNEKTSDYAAAEEADFTPAGGSLSRKESSSKPRPDPSKQDYIHVRARRGQATDSHSLAERVRRNRLCLSRIDQASPLSRL